MSARIHLPLIGQRLPGFRTSNRANTRALRGRGQSRAAKAGFFHTAQALEAVADAGPGNLGSAPDAQSILIAGELLPLGNSRVPQPTSSPAGALQFLRSSKHQPTHNIRGQCSERNPIPVRVRNDADLRAGRAHLSWKRSALRLFSELVGLLVRHPSFRSPDLVTAGVSQPQRVRSGDPIVGISHRALGNTSREIGGHQHVCVR